MGYRLLYAFSQLFFLIAEDEGLIYFLTHKIDGYALRKRRNANTKSLSDLLLSDSQKDMQVKYLPAKTCKNDDVVI